MFAETKSYTKRAALIFSFLIPNSGYLTDDCVLSIEEDQEDQALPTISLVELMSTGGNVELDSWVVTDDTVIDEVVAAAFTVLAEELSESQKKSAELHALIVDEQRFLWRSCDQ